MSQLFNKFAKQHTVFLFYFRAMSSSVTFVWPYGGEKVELAGSFNGWKPVEMKSDQEKKKWILPYDLVRRLSG